MLSVDLVMAKEAEACGPTLFFFAEPMRALLD
jgi:hypothetical protein